MLVFASIAIVGATPVPSIFALLAGLQEKLADDIRTASLDNFSFLFAYVLGQFLFG